MKTLHLGALRHVNKVVKTTVGFVMSARPSAWNISVPLSREFNFIAYWTKISGTLYEDLTTFMKSWCILPKVRKVSYRQL